MGLNRYSLLTAVLHFSLLSGIFIFATPFLPSLLFANSTLEREDGGAIRNGTEKKAEEIWYKENLNDPGLNEFQKELLSLVGNSLILEASNNGPLCAGQTLELYATDGADSYFWEGPSGFTSTEQNPVVPNAGLDLDGIFTVTATGGTCSGTAITGVEIKEFIIVNAGSNSPVCVGDNIQLFSSGGATFKWSGPNNFSSNGNNPIIFNANLDDAGIYTVIVGAGICKDTVNVVVEVLPSISVDYNIINADCNTNGEINLNVTGGQPPYSFDWADLPGTNNPEDRSDLTVGDYDVTISDGSGCGLAFNNLFVADFCGCDADAGAITADNAAACIENGFVNLTATPTGNQTIPPGYNTAYILTEGADLIIIAINTNPFFAVNVSGNYTIHTLVYDPITLDLSIIQFGVTPAATVLDLILQGGGSICASLDVNGAAFVVTEIMAAIVGTASASCNICNGSATLSPSSNLYEWSDNGTGANRNNLCTGSYNITATDGNGCSTVLNLTIGDDCTPGCDEPTVLNVVSVESSCGASTGSVLIELNNPSNYVYTWTPDNGTSTGNGNGKIGLLSDVYTIIIADAADPTCFTTITVPVGISDGPVIADIISTPSACSTANGSVTLLPATYQYTWVEDGFVGNSRSDLTSGPHNVVVTDPMNPNCPDIITVQVGEVNDLNAEAIINNTPTCGEANGVVTVNFLNGAGPNMTYQWTNGGTNSTEINLASGTYGVFITNEDSGCTFNLIFGLGNEVGTADVILDPFYEVSCVGSTDAEATFLIDPSPDFVNPPTVFITDVQGNIYENGELGPGQYCVIINDGNGCVAGTGCFNVVQPGAIEVDVTLTAADCQTDGAISVIVSGGNPLYTFDWADLPGTDDPLNRFGLDPGTYSLTVTDNNGCTSVASNLVIANNCSDCQNPPVVNAVIIVDSNCDQEDGQAIINMTTNFADFTYDWTPDLGQSNPLGNSRTNLPAGTYTVVITEINDPTCSTTEIFSIGNTDGPQVNIESITPAACSVNNGAAILTTVPGLNYTWSDGGFGPERFDLAATEYQVTVTDVATGCISIVIVDVPVIDELVFNIIVNAEPDCNAANGSVTAEVIGGSGSYFYSWGPNATLDNLASGAYVVTVSDLGTGCTAEQTFTLNDDVQGAVIVVDAVLEISCPGADDGFADPLIIYEAGFDNPPNINIVDADGNIYTDGQLGVGSYCVIVEDANGCLGGSACFEVIAPAGQFDLDVSITAVTCTTLGSIDLTVTGSNGPYLFNWADVAGTINPPDRFNLAAGLYSVTITDQNGCEVVADDLLVADDCNIAPPCTAPQVVNIINIASTCGESNGAATITLTNDPAQYTYQWTPAVSTTNSATGLISGVYTVLIANANDPDCTSEISFSIENADGPEAMVIGSSPATCMEANGTAVASPPNFIYEWCSGSVGFNGTDLPAGICFVTVTDPATGCTNILEVEIEEVNTLDASVVIDNDPDCNANNGTATILVTGGSANYSIQWSDGGVGPIRNDLLAGAYSVTVTDLGVTGCETIINFSIDNNLDPDAGATIIFGGNGTGNSMVSCAGSTTGFVDYNVSLGLDFAGFDPIIEIVDAAGNVYINGNIPPGNYCVQVTDENGCLAGSACFEISSPEPIDVNITLKNKTCDALGTIDLTVIGGTAPYTFDWADLPGTNDPEDRMDLEAGGYSVVITDANGCTAEAIELAIIDECLLCPTPDSVQLVMPVFTVDSFCVVIESCFDTVSTTFQLLSGGLQGSSANGFWSLDAAGCLFYFSTGNIGQNLDTIYVLANDNGLIDTTCIFVTITPPCFGLTGLDSVSLSTFDCDLGSSFCLPVPITEIGLYSFTDNGMPYTGGYQGCDFQMISTYPMQNLTDVFPNGPYALDSWMVNGTMFSLVSFNNLSELVAQMNIWDPSGGWFLNFNGNIQGGFSGNTYGFLDITHIPTGVSFTNTFGLGTINVPVGTLLAVDTGYHQIIMMEISTGCLDTIHVDVICNQCPEIYTGPAVVETELCDEFTQVCTTIPIGNLGNYLITDNGDLYTNGFEGCDLDTLSFYPALAFSNGTYTLDSWTVNGTTFSLPLFTDLQQLVDSMNVWDPIGNWTIVDDVFIYGGDYNNVYGEMIISQFGGPVGVFDINISFDPNGNSIGLAPGIHEVIFTDTVSGCTDTMNIEILCVACPEYTGNGLLFTFNCDEDGQLCLDIPVSNINNYTFTDNGLPYGGSLLGCDFDTLYSYQTSNFNTFSTYTVTSWLVNGVPNFLGFFSSLNELVNWMNNVDPGGNWSISNNIFITGGASGNVYGTMAVSEFGIPLPIVTPQLQLIPNGVGLNLTLGDHEVIIADTIIGCLDTINVSVQCLTAGLPDTIYLDILIGFTDTFCIDIGYLPGNLDTIYNFCEDTTGIDLNAEIILLDSLACFEFMGLEVGQETACFAFCDDLGNCDTLYVVIEVIPPSVDTILLTVILTDTDTICLDVSEIPGSFYTINNLCPDESGDFVLFSTEPGSVCVLYTGIDIGVDTACFEVCDEFGYCHTTILIVETILDPNGIGPIAVDDDTTGLINTPTIITVLENDTLNGTLADITILTDPVNGTVVVNSDFTISYIPNPEFCGSLDSFEYILTTSSGADTATVYIDVYCDELTVYSGFSPNFDGVNDGFSIKGINSFPDNEVRIYNRWGNEVYMKKGYRNDDPWLGTWKGKDLPDGTYFYVIDDGEGRKYSGYVQLHR